MTLFWGALGKAEQQHPSRVAIGKVEQQHPSWTTT